jgi:MinD-like ATPase involved in chromosome partitioning or flagellar assembly
MTATKGAIFTFYSFKGGVGRTMALANIGVHFYRQGYQTLVIDMDLEAPGLERYFQDAGRFQTDLVAARGGFIDFIQSYLQRASLPLDDPQKPLYPTLDDYLTDLTTEGAGRLTLMHAGRRWNEAWPGYVRFIQNFDWTDFYERWEGGACIESFAAELRRKFEIILIDSRTGVTEMGGVATQHLADSVVVFFGSNLQNVENSANMIRSFLGDSVLKARGGRALSVLAVPSRVDDQDSRGFAEFQKRIADVFASIPVVPTDGYSMDDMHVPYLAPFSYHELILYGDQETETSARRILESYGRIAANMQRLAPEGTALRAGMPSSRTERFQVALLASSQDELLAKELSAHLTQHGFDCMTFGGRSPSDEDSSRLNAMWCAIAIVTPAFGESAILRGLLQILTDLAKPIIPAIFSPVATMPLLLADKVSVDCSTGVSTTVSLLAEAIKTTRVSRRDDTNKPTGVYLSYHHVDLALADQIYQFLVGRGLSVWFDRAEIAPGSAWQTTIERALTDADIMVALLSPSSTESPDLRSQWTFFASELKKPVVPVVVTATRVPFLFARTQPIDLTLTPPIEDVGSGATLFEQLSEAIHTRLEEPEHTDDDSASRRVSREQKDRIRDEWIKFSPKATPLVGDQKWHVFLSYRSVHRAWVLNLYDILRLHGHKVFLDECVLKVGDNLESRLREELRASQAGVLVWSTAAKDSDWVRREYEVLERQATKKTGFQFVLVRLDTSELPAFAESRVFLDFSAYPDGPNGGELLRLMHAVVGLPLSDEAARFANQQDEAAKSIGAKIGAAIKNRRPERLVELFREGGLAFETSATLGCRVAEGLTKLGSNDLALSVLAELESRFPRAIRPKQLHALALARRGARRDLSLAQEILGELYDRGERDPETLGIYGRTWMDRYEKSGDQNDLMESRDLYAEAFERAPDDYYIGINAAAKSVLLGTDEDLARAADYASRVQKIVGTQPRGGDYWLTATVAEVFLIQKNYEEAAQLYEAAVATARSETGSHKTTWKQACRLMAKLQPSQSNRGLVRKPFMHLPDCNQL